MLVCYTPCIPGPIYMYIHSTRVYLWCSVARCPHDLHTLLWCHGNVWHPLQVPHKHFLLELFDRVKVGKLHEAFGTLVTMTHKYIVTVTHALDENVTSCKRKRVNACTFMLALQLEKHCHGRARQASDSNSWFSAVNMHNLSGKSPGSIYTHGEQ